MDTDTVNTWRELVKKILTELGQITYPASVNMTTRTVFDEKADRYLVVVEGWNDLRRLHGCMSHIEIRGDKIWILLDGTEYGLANELLDAGVPKDHIVLGFKAPQLRHRTGFAVA